MRKILLFASFLSICLFYACNDDSGEPDPEKKNDLSGKINGADWSFKVGYVKQEKDLSVVFELIGLDAEDGDVCDAFLTNKARLKFILQEAATGTYSQPRSIKTQSVRFIDAASTGGGIETAVSGSVVITEIGSDQISGTIDAMTDDDNNAKGSFTVEKCF